MECYKPIIIEERNPNDFDKLPDKSCRILHSFVLGGSVWLDAKITGISFIHKRGIELSGEYLCGTNIYYFNKSIFDNSIKLNDELEKFLINENHFETNDK